MSEPDFNNEPEPPFEDSFEDKSTDKPEEDICSKSIEHNNFYCDIKSDEVPSSNSTEGTDKMENKTQIENVTTLPKAIKDKLRDRLWRRSHSLNTLRMLDTAVRQFEKYLASKNMKFEDTLKNALPVIDDFCSTLDKRNAPRTARTYLTFVRKVYRAAGIKIDDDVFKDEIVQPKITPFQDDKVSEDQLRQILLAVKNEKLKCLLALLKDTVARPSEILGLRLSDLNLEYDPPYISIPSHLAKNDIPREVFFTPETKQLLVRYLEDRRIKNPNDFVFLRGNLDINNEEQFQRSLRHLVVRMSKTFRKTLEQPAFKDMNQIVEGRRKAKRYKIHLYSLKKFAFTKIYGVLGDEVKAIKGDSENALTYYKKSREERAEDYRKLIPVLSIFSSDEKSKLRKQVEDALKSLKHKDLASVLEYIQTAKALPEGSNV